MVTLAFPSLHRASFNTFATWLESLLVTTTIFAARPHCLQAFPIPSEHWRATLVNERLRFLIKMALRLAVVACFLGAALACDYTCLEGCFQAGSSTTCFQTCGCVQADPNAFGGKIDTPDGRHYVIQDVPMSQAEFVEEEYSCNLECGSMCAKFSQGQALVDCITYCGCGAFVTEYFPPPPATPVPEPALPAAPAAAEPVPATSVLAPETPTEAIPASPATPVEATPAAVESPAAVPTSTPAVPTSQEPVAAVPASPEPVAVAPATPEPAAVAPATAEPAAAITAIPEPALPVTPEPTAALPITPEPVLPATPEPTAVLPASPEPALPATPAAALPTTPEPAASTPEPTTAIPATPEPAVLAEPVAAIPTVPEQVVSASTTATTAESAFLQPELQADVEALTASLTEPVPTPVATEPALQAPVPAVEPVPVAAESAAAQAAEPSVTPAEPALAAAAEIEATPTMSTPTVLYSSVSLEVLEDEICSQRCSEMCTDDACMASCRLEFCDPGQRSSWLYFAVGVLCVCGMLSVAYTVFFGKQAKASRRRYQPRPQEGSYLSL